MSRTDERPRASSFSDATPRANSRPLALTDSRVGSSVQGGASGGAGFGQLGGTGGPPALPRKESERMVQDGGSLPASGRASPALSSRSLRTTSQTRGGSLRSPTFPPQASSASIVTLPPTYKTLDSYTSRHVVAALEPGPSEVRQIDDVWQAVCVRVLPLYNGEGVRGYVEELCELVSTHVQRTFARCQNNAKASQNPSSDLSSLVTGLLIADLSELLRIGTTTLAGKLSPLAPTQPLSDDKFLLRLNETWLFFWGSVLPHLEAIFWVLRCDQRLKAAVGGGVRERELQGRTEWGEGRIDVRKLALIEFRDHVIHPELDRLHHLFNSLFPSRPPSSGIATTPQPPPPEHQSIPSFSSAAAALASNSTTPAGSAPASRPPSVAPPLQATAMLHAAGRRRQMVAILASVLTGDERQAEMDILLRAMRSTPGTASPVNERRYHRPPLLNVTSTSTYGGRQAGDRRGFLGERGGSNRGQETPLSDEPSDWSEGGGAGTDGQSSLRRNGSGRLLARRRAGTMSSLDEDESRSFAESGRPPTMGAPVSPDGIGSMTPIGRRGSIRRALPLAVRSKSASDSVSTETSNRTATAGGAEREGTKLRRHSLRDSDSQG